MRRIFPIVCAVLAAFAYASSAAVSITTFGNSASPTFTVDNTFTDFTTVNQAANSTSVSGTAAQTLSGTFSAVDISAFQSQLRLDAVITVNPGGSYLIYLYDTSDRQATYSGGNWSTFSSSAFEIVNFSSAAVGFDFSDVYAADITSSGFPSDSLSGTFSGLSAVPEPTVAMLVGLAGLAGVALRRRRIS